MKKMIFRIAFRASALIALTVLLSSCSSTKVITDKDPSVDFAEFKTYEFWGWADNSDEVLSRLDKTRIQDAFRAEGRMRGMSRVDSGGDVIVSLNVLGRIKREQVANTTTMGMGGGAGMWGPGMGMWGPGWGHMGMMGPGWGWGSAHSTTVVTERERLEGSLIVEVYDPDVKELIWMGMGTQIVNDDPQKRAREIPKKVQAIMKRYPVKPIK